MFEVRVYVYTPASTAPLVPLEPLELLLLELDDALPLLLPEPLELELLLLELELLLDDEELALDVPEPLELEPPLLDEDDDALDADEPLTELAPMVKTPPEVPVVEVASRPKEPELSQAARRARARKESLRTEPA